ncbi:MAG TPA: hypothetical protein PLV50_14270 [Smithella sp.]|nr:hypothetical protein [Smithella sp.]HOG91705.1 hypothetical protein [Smithella sp.]
MNCLCLIEYVLNCVITITPIIIAALVATIAFWQYKVNKDKLRLDLYNRRFDIYSRTLDFYQALLSYNHSVASKESFSTLQKKFFKGFRESQFLFDEKSSVYSILDQMHTKSFQIIGFKERGEVLAKSDPDEFTKMNEQNMAALQWFNETIPKLEKAMSNYLNFQKLTE